MASGGFYFSKSSVTYNPQTNGVSSREWGLAVHLARCEAFLNAATREYLTTNHNGWSSVNTSLGSTIMSSSGSELTETVTVGGSSLTVYIQDWMSIEAGQSSAAAGFISFFRNNETNAEYCILTHSGIGVEFFDGYDISEATSGSGNGYNIHGSHLPKGIYDYIAAKSLAHAFAKDGFGYEDSGGNHISNYDVRSPNFLGNDCTKIFPFGDFEEVYSGNSTSKGGIVGTRAYNGSTSSQLMNSSSGTGYTFEFGYAVKGNQIEAFMRRNDRHRWIWCVIGEIFGTTSTPSDTHKVGVFSSYYETSSNVREVECMDNDLYKYSSDIHMEPYFGFTRADGQIYTAQNRNSVAIDTNRTGDNSNRPVSCMSCLRTSSSLPATIQYNSAILGASLADCTLTSSDTGVDGSGNGFKGFIDTDLMRVISGSLCQTCGATMENGNFVVMYSGHSAHGYALGWDSSNESIL